MRVNLEEHLETLILALSEAKDEVALNRVQLQLKCLELLLKVRMATTKGQGVKADNDWSEAIEQARGLIEKV